MDDLERTAGELAERFRFREPTLTFEPVTVHAPPAAVAVDGTSATLLDAGGLVVVAWRAATAWASAEGARATAGPLRLRVLDRKSEEERPVDGLRVREEVSAALAALATLPPGGLLLLDGSPPPEAALRLAEAATGRLVAAVSKSTGSALDGVPVLPAARRAARSARPTIPWAAAVGRGRYVVRASLAQDSLFLVDVLAGETAAVLEAVASLGTNPGVPGYPYILALAHQRAVLTEEEQDDARARLVAKAAEAGADTREIELAFHDYHEELDLGA